MASFSSSKSVSETDWKLIVTRILCVFAGICHLGSLLGFLIPFLLQSSTGVNSLNYSFEFLGIIRDIVGIFTAVIVFFSLRYTITGLIIIFLLNLAYSIFWMNLISISEGIMILLFGSFLYLTSLMFLYLWLNKLHS